MKFFKKAWDWLDGKKTAIGTVLLITADYLPQHTTAYVICSIAGQILGGVGILHKADKSEKLPEGLRRVSDNIKIFMKK